MKSCYLDPANTIPAPDVFHYEGVPQGASDPVMGSYETIGLRNDVCFDRYGRYGPYGLGYSRAEGGTDLGMSEEHEGFKAIWDQLGRKINYQNMNWGDAQRRCFELNKARFQDPPVNKKRPKAKVLKKVSRTAIVVRVWLQYDWSDHSILNFRALVNELSLKSGGEYDVHFLVQVKDNMIPIWASDEVYNEVRRTSVPAEFADMVTLWSDKQMEMIYPGPWGDAFENDSGAQIQGVYRSPHLSLQFFAHQHPEYEFFWNWEMDLRYTGHFYEFFNKVGTWAREQPRKGLWERSAKYYIPALHGTWENFTSIVEQTMAQAGVPMVLGPADFPGKVHLNGPEDAYEPLNCKGPDSAKTCGVGEGADLITLNPLFDANGSMWSLNKDVTGYDLNLPVPPRRSAIVTASRLSWRLLDLMHKENFILQHSMFAEMWPPSVALHHGLKATYAPHPIFADRVWPLETLEATFNGAKYGSSGGNENSPFRKLNENNFQGMSWYFNSKFSGNLWRRWLGHKENDEGGAMAEIQGTGRMCMRPVMLHPIKYEVPLKKGKRDSRP